MKVGREIYCNKVEILLAMYFDHDLTNQGPRIIEAIDKIEDFMPEYLFERFDVDFIDETNPISNKKKSVENWEEFRQISKNRNLEYLFLTNMDGKKSDAPWIYRKKVFDLRLKRAEILNLPCYLYFMFHGEAFKTGKDSKSVDKIIKTVTLLRNLLKTGYGFVHIGDIGLDWGLYIRGGAYSNLMTVEETKNLITWEKYGYQYKEKLRGVYWGNYWNINQVKKLGGIENLKKIHRYIDSRDGKEKIIDSKNVRIIEYENGDIFYMLSPNPLDWDINSQTHRFFTLRREYAELCEIVKKRNMFLG